MLNSNLWVSGELVNGSLMQLISIFYKESNAPPQLPTFVVVEFSKYSRPPLDQNNPTHLLVTPIKKWMYANSPQYVLGINYT